MDTFLLFFSAAGLRQLDSGFFWLVFVLAAAGSAVSFYFLWRFFRLKRLLEDTPTSRIRSAAQGYVELTGWGKQLPEHTTFAPLTALPCLWYRFKVEKYERDSGHGQNKGAWKVISKGVSDQNFILDDETGTCIVDPDGAEITPSMRDVWKGDVPNPLAARKSMNAGLGQMILGAGAEYRYTEERLIENDYLYVLGYHESLGGGRISFDHAAAVRDVITAWKEDYQSMLERFDANNDGSIDLREWEQVRSVARQEADRQKVDEDTSATLHMVVRPPDRSKPFLISSRTEEDLVTDLRNRALAGLGGFLLLGSYAAFMLSARVG